MDAAHGGQLGFTADKFSGEGSISRCYFCAEGKEPAVAAANLDGLLGSLSGGDLD